MAARGKRTTKNASGNILRGRFAKGRLPEVEAFTASLPFDRRLSRHDIRGSIAHANMLAKVKLISRADAEKIAKGLRAIEREIDAGKFKFDVADEDIHIAIERRLIEVTGDAGRKLHTARSRNDQIALDLRLFLKDEIRALIESIDRMRTSLLDVASAHVDTVMPGYTHMQRAQPVSLAHHILVYVDMLDRDRERFSQALTRTDAMPLGAGALAGTTLQIDREAVAEELGFARLVENSMDAVSDRDFAVDFLSASALLAVHLSRMSEEIILWSTAEFGFATLPDEFSTGSSMMPQKKNPDLLELIRGKSGRVIGDLVAMLTILKGLPLTYNSDLQEDKENVFDALDTIKPALDVMAKLWPRLEFDVEAMRRAAGGFALATDLAEYLVERGTPFREAHEIIGALVRETIAAGKSLEDLSLDDFRRHSPKFDTDVLEMLDPENSIKVRSVIGGPAPGMVRERIEEVARMKTVRAFALAAAIVIIGCGVKSQPIPPEHAIPERIVSLTAISQKNGVLLSWERPDRTAGGTKMRDLGSFEVDRAENTGAFRPLAEIPVTDQDRFQQQQKFSYLDRSAEVGHHYRYQVISSTLDAYRSDPSNEAKITHELPKPPPNPENFVIPQPKPLP